MIVDDLKALASSIESVTWEDISKTANLCADWIAKHAKLRVCPSDKVSRPPLALFRLIISDNSI